MTLVGKVSELWRYPVSSISGQELQNLHTTPLGIDGDRCFGLIETETAEPARPERDKRWHKAVDLFSRIDDFGETQVRGPLFDWIDVLAPELSGLLEEHFGFAVHAAPYENRYKIRGYNGPRSLRRYEPHQIHLLTTAPIARLK